MGIEQEPMPTDPQGEFMAALFDHLKETDSLTASAFFEAQLEKAGLLSKLEEAGIIPNAENPNPYNPEQEEEAHNKWWDEHPEEGEVFMRNFDNRCNYVYYMYIGAILGHNFKDLFLLKKRLKCPSSP